MSDSFAGLSKKTLSFLEALEANNNKPWFEAHRQDYERHVLGPMRGLVEELAPVVLMIDPLLDTTPRINRALSKIHRDTRFSKDKSPFRTTLWIVFKRAVKNWKETPGFFMEFSPRHYRYGMGFYFTSGATADAVREMIARRPDDFLAALAPLDSAGLELAGEPYKRIATPPAPGKIGEWLRSRHWYMVRNRTIDEAFFSPALVDDLAAAFNSAAPLYHFLRDAVDLAIT